MSEFLFDTCFLIDLERERRSGFGRAHAFMTAHPNVHPKVTWIVVGEFAEGFGTISHPTCSQVLGAFEVLEMDRETAAEYALAAVHLRLQRASIGTNDLWIAAAALANRIPIVTNNQAHFGRVPRLSVIGY